MTNETHGKRYDALMIVCASSVLILLLLGICMYGLLGLLALANSHAWILPLPQAVATPACCEKQAQAVPPTLMPIVPPPQPKVVVPTAPKPTVVVSSAQPFFDCSEVTSPTALFQTTDARTVMGTALIYPSGEGSRIQKWFAVVLKEPGVIAYGPEGKGNADLQKNVANGYAYWVLPGVNQFVLKQSQGKVTTISNGQYAFVSFGEGIISLKGKEYLFGQKDRGASGSTASRGWNIFIRTDGSAQDLSFRCVVPYENLTQLLPNGKTLSEDWAFQQIVNTHTSPPNCGNGCEEVAVVVIDQKTGLIAVASQVGSSSWLVEYHNVR